jgi:two-component system OmpR family response regulator
VPRVLIVDDDPAIRDVVRFSLARAGFETDEAADGEAALRRVAVAAPDIIVLDVLMPELDGIEVCRRLRRDSDVPILFLSSRDDEIDRVVGLEIGGDDYLVKPFSPRELVARVRAVLRRRRAPAASDGAVLQHGRLTLEPEYFRACWDAAEIALTPTEFGILRTLIAQPGRVYSRDNLMNGAYLLDRQVSDRTIDSHVRRVRAKFAAIGARPVETVHGLGYRLSACR